MTFGVEDEGSDQRFPQQARLKTQAEFQRTFQFKSSAADATLIVYAIPNLLDFSRLGLSVSRKVGNAVCRNQWKRRIREAFRKQKQTLPRGFDFVVIPRRGAHPAWDSIYQAVSDVFPRAARAATKRADSP